MENKLELTHEEFEWLYIEFDRFIDRIYSEGEDDEYTIYILEQLRDKIKRIKTNPEFCIIVRK